MTIQASKILVGFDFSSQAKRAAEVAIALADRNNGSVHVVTVFEDRLRLLSTGQLSVDTGDESIAEGEAQPESQLEALRHRMESVLRPFCPDPKRMILDAVEGKPFRKLLETAESDRADMIVVGASGAGRLERWILGSTSERVVRRASLPVLVVKQDQRWSPKRILCPVDFSTTSGRAAAYAAFLAEQWGASLELLHIIPGCDVAEIQALGMLQRVDVQRYLGDMRARADRRMAEFLSKWPLGKLMYRAEIHHGRPHEQILARAEDWAADLILIGTLGRDGVAGMLIGNTAERVLRGGPCSVLIVRAPSAKVSPQ